MKKSTKSLQKIEGLEEAFNGDLDLMLFYLTWVKNGLNATEAYLELHPDVTRGSAEVLGSRILGKVSKQAVLQAYGLDQQAYFKQLKDGLGAMKQDQYTGEVSPDHRTRRPYHEVLGKLMGIETGQPLIAQQINLPMPILGAITTAPGASNNQIAFVNFKGEPHANIEAKNQEDSQIENIELKEDDYAAIARELKNRPE